MSALEVAEPGAAKKVRKGDILAKIELSKWSSDSDLSTAQSVAFNIGLLVSISRLSKFEGERLLLAKHTDTSNISWSTVAASFLLGTEQAANPADVMARLSAAWTPNANVHFSATPYVWKETHEIPLRQFVYGRHLIRGYVTTDVAPGGVGKSTQIITDALAMTTGRPLLGDEPAGQLRCWLWNGEDPREEIERRVAAACGYYKITENDIGGRLFVDSGRENPIVIVTEDRNKIVYAAPIIDAVKSTIFANEIDVLVIDPFVSSHAVPENDNVKIAAVAQQWAQIADECQCAIQIVHHVRKGDGKEISVEDMRGAGSLANAARAVRLLNPMSAEEESAAGLNRGERFSYFRVSNGKSNLTKRSEHSEWRELKSFAMGNGKKTFEPQDHVGVVARWEWPSPDSLVADLEPGSLDAIKRRMRGGDYKESDQADNWAGYVVAEVLRLDASDKAVKKRIKTMFKTWTAAGHFKTVVRRCSEKRENKKFIDVIDESEDCPTLKMVVGQ